MRFPQSAAASACTGVLCTVFGHERARANAFQAQGTWYSLCRRCMTALTRTGPKKWERTSFDDFDQAFADRQQEICAFRLSAAARADTVGAPIVQAASVDDIEASRSSADPEMRAFFVTDAGHRSVSLRAEAETCRQTAAAYRDRPEGAFLLNAAREFDRLSKKQRETLRC